MPLGPVYLQGDPPAGTPAVSTDGEIIAPEQNQANLENLAYLSSDPAPINISGRAAVADVADGPMATTSAAGLVRLEVDGGTTAGRAAQASDTRLSLAATAVQPGNAAMTNARPPTGAAGGALTGTYPSPGLASPAAIDITGNAGSATALAGTAPANTVHAGPASGSPAARTDRALVPADIPSLDASKVTTGTFNPARLGSGTPSAGNVLYGTGWGAAPSGGGGAAPFDVLSLTGLCRFSRATHLQATHGDLIGSFWDSSGSGRTLVASGTNRPTFVGAATPNGRAALFFENNSQYMEGIATGAVVQNPSEWAFAVAFKATTAVAPAGSTYANPVIFAHEGQFFGLVICDNGGTVECRAYVWSGPEHTVAAPAPLNLWHVAVVRLSGGNLGISVDGGSESTIACGPPDDVSGHMRIGMPGHTSEGLFFSDVVMASPAPSFTALATYLMDYNGIS